MDNKENQLQEMLLSGDEKRRKQALITIESEITWRAIVQEQLQYCPEAFINIAFEPIIVLLKKYSATKQADLKRIGLKKFYKTLCKEYMIFGIDDASLVAMFQEGGTARTQAQEICYRRFKPKIYNTLRR